jgi:hypothetical protein
MLTSAEQKTGAVRRCVLHHLAVRFCEHCVCTVLQLDSKCRVSKHSATSRLGEKSGGALLNGEPGECHQPVSPISCFRMKRLNECARQTSSLPSLLLCMYRSRDFGVYTTCAEELLYEYQLRDTRRLTQYPHIPQHAKHTCEVQDLHCATLIMEDNHLSAGCPPVFTREPGEQDV